MRNSNLVTVMGMRRWIAGGIVLLLLVSLMAGGEVKAGFPSSQNPEIIAANATANFTELNVSKNASLALLRILDRLHNYTERVMNETNSDEALQLYERGNKLREDAWKLYNEGKYGAALKTALEAMHAYRMAIVFATRGEHHVESNATLIKRAELELRMANRTVGYAKVVLERFNVTNRTAFEKRINATVKAMAILREDINEGNTSKIAHDMTILRRERERLMLAIKTSMRLELRRKAPMLVRLQLMKLKHLERHFNLTGMNVSIIGPQPIMIQRLLQSAVLSGNPIKALEVLDNVLIQILRLRERIFHVLLEKGHPLGQNREKTWHGDHNKGKSEGRKKDQNGTSSKGNNHP